MICLALLVAVATASPLVNPLAVVGNVLTTGGQKIANLTSKVNSTIQNKTSNSSNLVNGLGDVGSALTNTVGNIVGGVVGTAGDMVNDASKVITLNVTQAGQGAKSVIQDGAQGAIDVVDDVVDGLSAAGDGVEQIFGNVKVLNSALVKVNDAVDTLVGATADNVNGNIANSADLTYTPNNPNPSLVVKVIANAAGAPINAYIATPLAAVKTATGVADGIIKVGTTIDKITG